jgi:uncharacterized protein (DUF885 family)
MPSSGDASVRETTIAATDPALDRLVQSYLDLKWHLDPVEATFAGSTEHDRRLGQYTAVDVDQHVAALKAIHASLEALDLDSIDDEIDRTAVLNDVRIAIHRFTVEQPHHRNPAFWVRHLVEGLYVLLAVPDNPGGEPAPAAMSRLAGVPAFLANAEQTLTAFPPPFVETALASIEGVMQLIDNVSGRMFADPASIAVQAAAKASLSAFGRFLEGQLGTGATHDGFAIGEDAFNFRLRIEHGVGRTAKQLWDWSLAAAADAAREVEERARAIDPSARWPDVLDRLRDQHPAVDALKPAYMDAMHRAREFVRHHDLVSVPPGAVDVVETPSSLAPVVPIAAYLPPKAFGSDHTGLVFVTRPGPEHAAEDRRRMLRDHCVHQLAERAVHETYPGHHLHFVTSHEQPRIVRKVIGSAISHEGWAHYCELMMREAGFFEGEAEVLFHEVASLERVLRVVLDVGLHTQGMSYQGAVSALVDAIHIDRRRAEAEVRRYCAMPTVQLCYAIGRKDILALRDAYRSSRGGNGTLRGFHDALLAFGRLPISLAGWGMGLAG